jgi:hypothetical protein
MRGVTSLMKTFKKFFEASAADYVAPKDDDDEAKDIKPRSKGEKKFKDDHKIDKKKYPAEAVKEGELPPALKKAIAKKKGEEPEDEDELDEDVFSDLENIVKKKSMKKVKFANGKTLEVDLFTASAFVNMFKKVNPKNAERGKAHIEKSPENFMKMMDLAMGGSKK